MQGGSTARRIFRSEMGGGERVAGPHLDVPWTFADVLAATALFIVLTLLAGAMIQGLSALVRPPYVGVASVALASAALGVSAVGWLRIRDRRWPPLLMGARPPNLADIGIGVLVGLLMFVVITLGIGSLVEVLFRSLGEPVPPVQESLQRYAADPRTTALMVLATVVIAPIAEEIFFRGLIFTAMRRSLGTLGAVGASALIFAATHFQSTAAAYGVVVAVIFPVGLVLAALYARRPSLSSAIVAHAVYNLVQLIILTMTASSPGGPGGQG